MNSAQKISRKSLLVDIMVSGKQRDGVGGILVNDPNGLCLVTKGNMLASVRNAANSEANSSNSFSCGVYSSLTKLASTLTPYQISRESNDNPSSPLITVEMEGAVSIVIKEYDGHAVAMKLPNR